MLMFHALFDLELKELRAHLAFDANINRDVLCLFMRRNNVGGRLHEDAGVVMASIVEKLYCGLVLRSILCRHG